MLSLVMTHKGYRFAVSTEGKGIRYSMLGETCLVHGENVDELLTELGRDPAAWFEHVTDTMCTAGAIYFDGDEFTTEELAAETENEKRWQSEHEAGLRHSSNYI